MRLAATAPKNLTDAATIPQSTWNAEFIDDLQPGNIDDATEDNPLMGCAPAVSENDFAGVRGMHRTKLYIVLSNDRIREQSKNFPSKAQSEHTCGV